MKCNRTCDGTRFPVNKIDYILLEVGNRISWKCRKSVLYDIKLIKKEDNSFKKASIQGEKVVLAKCQKALIGGTKLLPTSALGRPRSPLLASLYINFELIFIQLAV